jgi:hypothetical protein
VSSGSAVGLVTPAAMAPPNATGDGVGTLLLVMSLSCWLTLLSLETRSPHTRFALGEPASPRSELTLVLELAAIVEGSSRAGAPATPTAGEAWCTRDSCGSCVCPVGLDKRGAT